MTNEAIKALMLLAMYGVLELALYLSSTRMPAKQPARSTPVRASNSDLTSRWPED
ncbi:hypothetical protein [Bradyrhizobium sp. BR 10289]|uniref:hypothetical protein n=1 Tax=Bradyrhizobium sp. BR 10289 TaxID=2749993 RepID=UPI001C645974|nr:hypothetical protein [Bradyrhizobium sp. BR 10289]MBW7971179.1 hypothetical protein [Bradyrhizobium sp. BR 10289]